MRPGRRGSCSRDAVTVAEKDRMLVVEEVREAAETLVQAHMSPVLGNVYKNFPTSNKTLLLMNG